VVRIYNQKYSGFLPRLYDPVPRIPGPWSAETNLQARTETGGAMCRYCNDDAGRKYFVRYALGDFAAIRGFAASMPGRDRSGWPYGKVTVV